MNIRLRSFSVDDTGRGFPFHLDYSLHVIEEYNFKIPDDMFCKELMLVDMGGTSPAVIGKNLGEIITEDSAVDERGLRLPYVMGRMYNEITKKKISVIQADLNGWSFLRYNRFGYSVAWIRSDKLDIGNMMSYKRHDFDAIYDNYRWYRNGEDDEKIYD